MVHEIKKQAIKRAIIKHKNISYKELADIFNVSREYLLRLIRDEELPRRQRGAGSLAWRLRHEDPTPKCKNCQTEVQSKTQAAATELAATAVSNGQ